MIARTGEIQDAGFIGDSSGWAVAREFHTRAKELRVARWFHTWAKECPSS